MKFRPRQRYCSAKCRKKHAQEKADAAKYSTVSSAKWEQYKRDPKREHKAGTSFVVCRECPQKHAALQRHIISRHHISIPQYLEKWDNSPLIAQSVRDALRNTHAGKPHKYARGKKYLGENVRGKNRTTENQNNHNRPEVPPVDDATFALSRLTGKSITEIASEARLNHVAVQKRLKYLGFPPGRAYLFLHGKPITKNHFDDLCKDFGVAPKEIIKVVGDRPPYEVRRRIRTMSGRWREGTAGSAPKHYYECFLNHLMRRNPEDILLAKACRKNYTLQNPDFCGSLVFRGFGG